MPWARHLAGHTYAFDDTVAWLAVACSKTAVCELMRIAWRTVGAIVARVWADTENSIDRFAGLRRIGIDEISYKRHHKYLTVVVDHDSGRLVWAAPGRDTATLRRFFDALGVERCAQITHVSADAADWITAAKRSRINAFTALAKRFEVYFDDIIAAIELGISNALIEGINAKIRLINARGYGHHSAQTLTSMIYLCLGGLDVKLPTTT